MNCTQIHVTYTHSILYIWIIIVVPMSTSTSPGIVLASSLKQSDYTSTIMSTHMDGPITTSTNVTDSRSTPLLMIVGELRLEAPIKLSIMQL